MDLADLAFDRRHEQLVAEYLYRTGRRPRATTNQTDEKELGLLMAGITDTDSPHSMGEIQDNLAHAGDGEAK